MMSREDGGSLGLKNWEKYPFELQNRCSTTELNWLFTSKAKHIMLLISLAFRCLHTKCNYGMKSNVPSPIKRKADVQWVKIPYPNLNRYKTDDNYFGHVRVNGKLIRRQLIRRSLEPHVLTVAKLYDFLQDHRRLAVTGEVIIEMFKKEIEDDHNNKPRTNREVMTALKNRGRNCIPPTLP
jgi:hypothetical protein